MPLAGCDFPHATLFVIDAVVHLVFASTAYVAVCSALQFLELTDGFYLSAAAAREFCGVPLPVVVFHFGAFISSLPYSCGWPCGGLTWF